MSQSPELAGGEGFTFEGDVAAYYLSALLAEAYAPGIEDRIVVRVSVQQRDFDEPLDDVIIDFEDATKNSARLSLQVKRSLTISNAETNTDLRDIIRDSWATLNKPGFRVNIDRYGTAVGTISVAKERSLKTLCDWARESLTVDHFERRFKEGGNASASIKSVKKDIESLLAEVGKGTVCTNDEVHKFLAHFLIIQFDFLREGATSPSEAINHIKASLAPGEANNAPAVWSKFVQLSRGSAGKAGQFDRARLVRLISHSARLNGATSLRHDLDKVTSLARSYAALIQDDVGGAKLDRPSLLKNLDIKLAKSRIVQVRGLPGSGKSVLMRQAVERALNIGPVIFLKAEQLEGTSWISYAASQALSGGPLEQLLVEIGAVGSSILFIDAIDRIEKEQQLIIVDLMRIILESPLLDNWSVVVSLRDSGIELLRNWLGNFLDAIKIETLEIGPLDDEEAEVLAIAKPKLRSLLFGSSQVREIVRRPFFAKVLSQHQVGNSSDPVFAPQSELDLIENWWQRGGYNEVGQNAIERQKQLLELASCRARNLSQPIRMSQLTSISHINNLKLDGILQSIREGVSINFSHDIFFEWAFFYVIADSGFQWIEELRRCGEPPAVARVVELTSQWEYTRGNDWAKHLAQAEDSTLRSQWLRAWLIGPFGTSQFTADENQFATAVFANEFRLFKKTLVWFQAEKTSPNENILKSDLSHDQRQRFAYLLGWPSDFAAWRRLIAFILHRISDIPPSIYPDIVSIFEVWQNFLAEIPNPTSQAIVQQCATWLSSMEKNNVVDNNSTHWDETPDFDNFKKDLVKILLKSSKTNSDLAANYLLRLTVSDDVREDIFYEVINYSRILSESLPQLLVDLSLKFFKKELPDDQVAREYQEREDAAQWRKTILAKPELERSRHEKLAIDGIFSTHIIGDFSDFDWERLSINDDFRCWPPSPLREPFHSLFQSSPNEALRLLRELCNHAMSAWRQLHNHSFDHGRTPIPLELKFPWGTQQFWGTDREYLWCLSNWAPKIIGAGFMALEEWCFAELTRGRSTDDLIQHIVVGNECIAILGIASILALHGEVVSETTLPLITSQRLLAADRNRLNQDYSSSTKFIGFKREDKSHIDAVRAANERPVRKSQLSSIVPSFIFTPGSVGEFARDKILNFKNDLPFQYEEHRNDPDLEQGLIAQALQYAELADPLNYHAYRQQPDSDLVEIVHVSPSAAEPENVARVKEASKFINESNLWFWASKSIEEKKLHPGYIFNNAIEFAKELDSSSLFEYSDVSDYGETLGVRRGAVAATAATVLNFRTGLEEEDIEWARDVLIRAIQLPEVKTPMWSSASIIPWHHDNFVARGFAADVRSDTDSLDASQMLLMLIAHPLENVSLIALEEICALWSVNSKLTWAGLILAFSLCHVPPRSHRQSKENVAESDFRDEFKERHIFAALEYLNEVGWTSLPLPPPAWVKVSASKNLGFARQRVNQLLRKQFPTYKSTDMYDDICEWASPEVFWRSKHAAEILKRTPLENILKSAARTEFIKFLSGVLDWTIEKISPQWKKHKDRNRYTTNLFEWLHELGRVLGRAAGLIPLSEFRYSFLEPILSLEDEDCWALLSPFTSAYVCAHVYDAEVPPDDAFELLELCLERLLQGSVFIPDSYRSGELSGYDQPDLVRTLMFVSVERADLAARYVNGDWTEIHRILPLIDRFIRAGGWAASIMTPFLTFCGRAKTSYPAENFADQILHIIGSETAKLKGWSGTFIPADIADLVQYFSHRDTPMTPSLAQKFLRILDILVDMGDRRSAALQLAEEFREVRISA